jgi:Caspase domain
LRWAIVIGIDQYGADPSTPTLLSAVEDAEAFRRWVIGELGGDDADDRVYTLLARRSDDSDRIEGERRPTKDNVLGAISELMAASRGGGEKLFFFFSGHGLTSIYANRDESALVFPGVDDSHPSQTLAVRSIAEFFETTQFQDQFFFIDACRSPLERSTAEIGPWMIPRRRAPGQEPVQQFIMYATSPGRPAKPSLWPEHLSAFSSVLMGGLEGKGAAKAWSWERNCYEVRWERLATYVKAVMENKRTMERVDEREPPEDGWPFQIPQDIGIRGVAHRDRDALLARPRGQSIERHKLTVLLNAEAEQRVDLAVVDAVDTEVASARNLTGDSYTFELQPKTYSVRATTTAGGRGRVRAPVHLYDDCDDTLVWGDDADPPVEDRWADGTIEIRARDPLAVADIRDDTGWWVGVATQKRGCETPPGFYQVRLVGPERDKTAANDEPVRVLGGMETPVELAKPAVDERAAELARALGGSSEDGHVVPVAGAEPAAWAEPSTVAVAAIGAALQGDREALARLRIEQPLNLGEGRSGLALVAVAKSDPASLSDLQVRIWQAGSNVPEDTRSLASPEAGIAAVVELDREPQLHWLSIKTPEKQPTVVALPLLKDCLATVVAQVDRDRVRLYQFHPTARAGDWSGPDWLRRLENLQRQLLGGRLDGADQFAEEIATYASNDPFAACLAGYVLLRLGWRENLGELASAIIEAAPTLSDAYILRGEYEAHVQNQDASNQAFADAVSTGVPAFGEGLTRLVEGLRVSGFFHPRGALVRYIFQRHARGSMWAAFTPKNEFEPGRLVITGSDIGYEG